MSTRNERCEKALAADPLRAWLVRQVGIVIGADDALADYEAHFRATWEAQAILARIQTLGVEATVIHELLGDTLATSRLGRR